MEKDTTKPLSKVIRIDEREIRDHLDKMVRGTVEETLNALLDAEADDLITNQKITYAYDVTVITTSNLELIRLASLKVRR